MLIICVITIIYTFVFSSVFTVEKLYHRYLTPVLILPRSSTVRILASQRKVPLDCLSSLASPHHLHEFCPENCATVQRLTQYLFISRRCLWVVYLCSCYLTQPNIGPQLYLAVHMEQAMEFLYQQRITSHLAAWMKREKLLHFVSNACFIHFQLRLAGQSLVRLSLDRSVEVLSSNCQNLSPLNYRPSHLPVFVIQGFIFPKKGYGYFLSDVVKKQIPFS